MKFNRVFTLMESEISNDFYVLEKNPRVVDYHDARDDVVYHVNGDQNDPIGLRLDDEIDLNRYKKIPIKSIVESIKKSGLKGTTGSGKEYYLYSKLIPYRHEGINLRNGRNIVFLLFPDETLYCFYEHQKEGNKAELEAKAKKILSKFKGASGKKGEEEHPILKPGTIMYSSWGYEQTNIDFYVVIRSNKTAAWINEIPSVSDYNDAQMTGTTMPDVKNIKKYMDVTPKTIRKKIHQFGKDPSISLNSFSSAYVWDGRAKRYSTYG